MKQFVLAFIFLPFITGFLLHGPPMRAISHGVRMTNDNDSKSIQQELIDLKNECMRERGAHMANDEDSKAMRELIDVKLECIEKLAAWDAKITARGNARRAMFAPDSALSAKFASLGDSIARLESSIDNFIVSVPAKMKDHRVSMVNEINGVAHAAFWSPMLAFVIFGLAILYTSPEARSLAGHAIAQAVAGSSKVILRG
jgi:hypothetical protein